MRDIFYLYWLNNDYVRSAVRRMYSEGLIEHWNPITGCCHDCVYCWARRLALTRLKRSSRYREGFKPRFNEKELKRKFKHRIVFVGFMGDMWAECIPDTWIRRVLERLQKFDDGSHLFFFLTKNPDRYRDFLDIIPRHSLIGVTIETNRDEYFEKYKISRAPLPSERYKAFVNLNWHWKNITIEPVMDFDMDVMLRWVESIDPVLIYVGYDSLRVGLPEPALDKVKMFVRVLERKYFLLHGLLREPVSNNLCENSRY